MMRATLAIVVLSLGCGRLPIEPTRTAPAAAVDPRAVPIVAMLETIETPLPWNGETFREWRARLNVPIRVEPLERDYAAVWTGEAVILNAHLTGYDMHGQAAIIAHELRHADGIRHDCGPHQDKRATAWSAYAVQIWTLEQFGAFDQAKGNEGGYCD
jgi:hypothetical protein